MRRRVFTLPAGASEILRTDEADDIYYQVLGLRGEYLSGDRALPVPADEERAPPGEVRFRDDTIHNDSVRVAYMWVNVADRGAGTGATAARRWCRWPRRWANVRAWPPRSSRA